MRRINEWNNLNKDIIRMYTSIRVQDVFSLSGDNDRQSSFEQVLIRVFRAGQDDGELRLDMPAELLARYFRVMYSVVFLDWLMGEDESSVEKNLEVTVDLFLSGAVKS